MDIPIHCRRCGHIAEILAISDPISNYADKYDLCRYCAKKDLFMANYWISKEELIDYKGMS